MHFSLLWYIFAFKNVHFVKNDALRLYNLNVSWLSTQSFHIFLSLTSRISDSYFGTKCKICIMHISLNGNFVDKNEIAVHILFSLQFMHDFSVNLYFQWFGGIYNHIIIISQTRFLGKALVRLRHVSETSTFIVPEQCCPCISGNWILYFQWHHLTPIFNQTNDMVGMMVEFDLYITLTIQHRHR
jgi:hypothetical protein